MSEGKTPQTSIAASVPREAFERLMLEYLESEGKQPTPEVLAQVCDLWLESHDYGEHDARA